MTSGDHRKENRKPHWPSYARGLRREADIIAKTKEGDFKSLIIKAERINESYYRAQSLAWIARKMSGSGADHTPIFRKAIAAAMDVNQEWRRSEILILLAEEMSKAGEKDYSHLLEAVKEISDPGHREKALKTVNHRITRAIKGGAEIVKQAKPAPNFFEKSPGKILKSDAIKERSKKNLRARISLGLYNTYEGKTLKDAHIRTVARAAPLCYAFNLNLCLFAFPLDDPSLIASIVEKRTQVGEGGKYLRMLFECGMLSVSDSPKEPVLKDLGVLVAATANPVPEKRIEIDAMSEGPYCVIMGLGSSGLPKKILTLSQHHLELTGRNIPLETCTAMGVLASKLSLC